MDKYDKEIIIKLLNTTKDKIYLKPISEELYKIVCYSELLISRFNELQSIMCKTVNYKFEKDNSLCDVIEDNIEMYEDNYSIIGFMYLDNLNLKHKELKKLKEIRDNIELIMLKIILMEDELLTYNSVILYTCNDCGKEERNPGLDCCGSCYDKRIWGLR